jgi:hypothetical protein
MENCDDTILILDQRNLTTGRKNASDAAYTLAMHLTAYLLNQAAGAYDCDYAGEVAGQAQELLLKVGFNGTGTYLKKKGADKNEALRLADILDRYNNNDEDLDCDVSSKTASRTTKGSSAEMEVDTSIESISITTVEAYPIPFRDVLNLQVDIAYDANVRIQLFGLDGRLVMTFDDNPVSAGSNLLRLPIDYRVPEATFILRVYTGREVISKTVISNKN